MPGLVPVPNHDSFKKKNKKKNRGFKISHNKKVNKYHMIEKLQKTDNSFLF